MLVHMSSINKQMRTRPGGRDAQLAHLWQDQGTRGRTVQGKGGLVGGRLHVCHTLLTLSLSEARESEHVHIWTHTHMHTNTHTSLTPNPQRLISVSDKLGQQVHSALHNKSISRVIEFHQSPYHSSAPRGQSLGHGRGLSLGTVQLLLFNYTLFFPVKRPWYHYHLMNIYNWI